jgi:hypothetical protein
MKPYQFYTVGKFPKLAVGASVKNQVQLTFSGEGEDVETSLTLKDRTFEGTLALVRVKSEVKYETFGFIKTVVDNKRRKLDFTEYLQPVDFQAYYDEGKNIFIFQAPKKVCRGVLSNLRGNPCGVDLIEMVVDFAKVMDLCTEYQGAWFRGVSSHVRAAGLSGDQIQHDGLFKRLLKVGEHSNVTIPWLLDNAEHRVMVTSTGAIILIQDYKMNQGLELQVVVDVYDKLLSKVWIEKKGRRQSDSIDIPLEP